jgi:hypothetical protein
VRREGFNGFCQNSLEEGACDDGSCMYPPGGMVAGATEMQSMSVVRLSVVRSPMQRCRFIIEKEAKSMFRGREIVG